MFGLMVCCCVACGVAPQPNKGLGPHDSPGDVKLLTFNSTCPAAPASIAFDTNSIPATTGATWRPTTGAQLQQNLTDAHLGDKIILDTTVTYSLPANFTLPVKTGSGWIVIISSQSGAAGFPAPGHRILRSQRNLLAKVKAMGGNAAFFAPDGSSHYWLIGVEVYPDPGTATYESLIQLGTDSDITQTPSVPAQYASNIVVDRSFVHGTTLNDTTQISVKHAVVMDGGNLALVNSRVANIHTPIVSNCPGAPESQPVYSGNGTGALKIDNNYISGGSEGVDFGGSEGAPTDAAHIPHDITITHNHIYKPLSWTSTFLGKNSFETKAAQRVLFSGNYVQNSWDNCGTEQMNLGSAMRLTPRSQSGVTPWVTVTDLNITNNKFTGHDKGPYILGSDDNEESGQLSCVNISNNVITVGNGPGTGDRNGRAFEVISGGMNTGHPGGTNNLTIQHNTIFSHNNAGTAVGPLMICDFSNCSDGLCTNPGFTLINNLVSTNGFFGNGENATLDTFFPGYTFGRNDFVGGNSANYTSYCSTDPNAANYCFYSASNSTVGFTSYNANPALANYQLLSSSNDYQKSSDSPRTDIGVNDWSSTTGVGQADAAIDIEPDDPPGCSICSDGLNRNCVDKTTDLGNCGSCGNACAPGQTCTNGVCAGSGGCGSGLTLCGSSCVDTSTDPNNCGGCGITCTAGQTCTSSSCGSSSSGRSQTGTDLNGDLKGDFFTRDSSGNIQFWKSNATIEAAGTSFLTSYDDVDGYNLPAEVFAMDLDGDGKTDLLSRGDDGTFEVNQSDGTQFNWVNEFATTLSVANGWDALVNRLFPADVNGDGKTDLLARQTDGTWQVWLSNGTALVSSGTFTSYYTDTGSWGSGDHFYFLDINGDGKTDFVARGQNGGWDVNISNGSTYSGSSAFSTTYTDANGFNTSNHFFVADVDGDKKADLLVRNANGTFDVWKSNGTTLVYNTSFTSYFTDAGGFQTGNRFMARDVNGDGRTDLIMRYTNGTLEEWFSNGTTLSSAYTFTTALTDANGWNSGFRFY